MPKLSAYELEREANIARNRALLEELDLKGASTNLGLPAARKTSTKEKLKAKPIQPARKPKREREETVAPRRQSTRLRKEMADPNESPSKKRKREEETEARRLKDEQDRLEAEERAREARRPRHQDLDVAVMGQTDGLAPADVSALRGVLNELLQASSPKRAGNPSDFVFEDKSKEEAAVQELRTKLGKLKVVSRAKVTQDRIYSAAYHPEKTKDLIFFGDKHGQLGIWDARAPPDEVQDDDGEFSAPEQEGGKYWRLQPHWPATSKSSISAVKMDPIDSHSVFTSAYDCTVRSFSFTTGISREVFSIEDVLITSIDLPLAGNEMWVSDADGGVTHLDLRESKSKARRWELAQQKIGCVSVNPTFPLTFLTASNDRTLKLWDVRKLWGIPLTVMSDPDTQARPTSKAKAHEAVSASPDVSDYQAVQSTLALEEGNPCRCQFSHGKSASSAFWDPRGRNIVSTSYDDKLRIWDVGAEIRNASEITPFKPFCRINHNCQTGKWLTILKAQWSPNPDIYPHFTIGNMEHSLDVFGCRGDVVARLSDRQRITAVQAVTCSHPGIIERAASGNASGRCVLWAPDEPECFN